MASRQAGFAETERVIAEEMSTFAARKRVLDQDTAREGNAMSIVAPCPGTVVKLRVQHPGTVVHEEDLLAEMVCADEPLQAELLLPERGLALVRIGQPVKLLYDAFPYERYGVQYAHADMAQPGVHRQVRRARRFGGLPTLGAATVGVQGRQRSVLPGMTGRAAVIVGRRSLASYAIEPLRQMRESFATGPSEIEGPGPEAGR